MTADSPGPQPWSLTELRVLARGAVARIDREGVRGATSVSLDEIVAMAGMLALDLSLYRERKEDQT
jgi:hypothetical protein